MRGVYELGRPERYATNFPLIMSYYILSSFNLAYANKPHENWRTNQKIVVFFIFNGLSLEVVADFVDIDRIIDHHCLSFLLMKLST